MKRFLELEHWNTLSEEGNIFYVGLAKKYINNKGSQTPVETIENFIKDNIVFLDSEEEMYADASSKETQEVVREFLRELLHDENVDDEILKTWEKLFWQNLAGL